MAKGSRKVSVQQKRNSGLISPVTNHSTLADSYVGLFVAEADLQKRIMNYIVEDPDGTKKSGPDFILDNLFRFMGEKNQHGTSTNGAVATTLWVADRLWPKKAEDKEDHNDEYRGMIDELKARQLVQKSTIVMQTVTTRPAPMESTNGTGKGHGQGLEAEPGNDDATDGH